MRDINLIVIHCSATQPKADIGRYEIDKMHRARGWMGIGYHYVIRRDGVLEFGRPIDKAGAHAESYNLNSIGICLVGGVDATGRSEDNFEKEQMWRLQELLGNLNSIWPAAAILGHRDLPSVAKDCPCFDVRAWLVRNTPIRPIGQVL